MSSCRRKEVFLLARASAVHNNQSVRQEKPAVELRVVRGEANRKKRVARVRFYFVSVVLVGLVLVSLFCRVRLTELNEQINQNTKKLAVLESEELRLRAELEDSTCIYNLEEKAGTLGMEKLHDYQIEYVNISRSDDISVEG